MPETKQTLSLSLAIFFAFLTTPVVFATAQESDSNQAEVGNQVISFPKIKISHTFLPPGESNVRSSIKLSDSVALIGTEETGDVFKTTDGGKSWKKTIDGGDKWTIQDIRNFIRADDGCLYATTSEPALVLRSEDEGETWDVVAKPKASRTVALSQLETGEILVGLRRSDNSTPQGKI